MPGSNLRYRALPLIASPLEQYDSSHGPNGHENSSVIASMMKGEEVVAIQEHDKGIPTFHKRGEASSIDLFYDLFFVANLMSFTNIHTINTTKRRCSTSV